MQFHNSIYPRQFIIIRLNDYRKIIESDKNKTKFTQYKLRPSITLLLNNG